MPRLPAEHHVVRSACLAVLATALIIGQMLASRLRDPQPPARHGLAVSGLYRPPGAPSSHRSHAGKAPGADLHAGPGGQGDRQRDAPARSPAIMPIPGTTSIAHIRENLDAQDIDLSREDMQSINNFAPEGHGH